MPHWLRSYYAVPSLDGFSGYRSGGWLVHTVFSAMLVAGVAGVFQHLSDLPPWAVTPQEFRWSFSVGVQVRN